MNVSLNKKSAIVRNLLTEDRNVNIQDVRFVQPPSSEIQTEEWNQLLKREVKTTLDPEHRGEVLRLFWEKVQYKR